MWRQWQESIPSHRKGAPSTRGLAHLRSEADFLAAQAPQGGTVASADLKDNGGGHRRLVDVAMQVLPPLVLLSFHLLLLLLHCLGQRPR